MVGDAWKLSCLEYVHTDRYVVSDGCKAPDIPTAFLWLATVDVTCPLLSLGKEGTEAGVHCAPLPQGMEVLVFRICK
jgi:hypothetical protein